MEQALGYLPQSHRSMTTGSILHLDLMKRKRILYTLLKTQKNKIEHVETLVIRSDGKSVDGHSYFTSPESLEYGYSPLILDSINSTLDGLVSNISDIDLKRRKVRTDEEIDKERALALDRFYADVVTRRNLEGLIFKDLSSPYCFGAKYRKLGYWYKLKDDYSQSGHATDIDVVVVGASFASGTRNAKYLNSFLIACVDDDNDSEDGTKYMTLGACNGNVIGDENLRKLLEKTGYKVNAVTGEIDYGSWFKSTDNPPFISSRTYQFSSAATRGGWKPDKKDKPDLWINPEDSFVLTTYAGEIVATKHFSARSILAFSKNISCPKGGVSLS
jgi:ATP-dependent DNA ligase